MKDKFFLFSILCVVGVIILFYGGIIFGHNLLPFNTVHYQEAYHVTDIYDMPIFNAIRGPAAWDGQWYIKIATFGYSTNLQSGNRTTFSFFPLYPLILSLLNRIFANMFITAAILSAIFLIANAVSSFIVTKEWYGQNIALRTTILLFTFPLSIFYHTYYTEGLFLLEFIWFCKWFLEYRWLRAAILLGLMSITRGVGIFLFFPFVMHLAYYFYRKKITFLKAMSASALSLSPIGIWSIFNFLITGNPIYFLNDQEGKLGITSHFMQNINTVLKFSTLAFHEYYNSKVEVVMVFITLFLLLESRRVLKPILWWMSFLLWIGPLFVHSLESFSRYQIVSFPLFIYGAHFIRGKTFTALVILFTGLFLFLSIAFVDWYWIG